MQTFIKYPRTKHLFGKTDDSRHYGASATAAILASESLIIEEKLDGANVGVRFETAERCVLQCRGTEITGGDHPQYDLLKSWVGFKQDDLYCALGEQHILFAEWLYARHSISYRALPHFFLEFDIYDRQREAFLDLASRAALLEGTGVQTVPVVHRGPITEGQLHDLVRKSLYDSRFEDPSTGVCDDLCEGLYLRTEQDGVVEHRAKFVRPAFIDKVRSGDHWKDGPLVPNLLASGVDIWQP